LNESKSDKQMTIAELKEEVKRFIEEREWTKYHNPKDLAESICIEAAELLQLFQWLRLEEYTQHIARKPRKLMRIKEELADVVIYCLSMANRLDVDLTEAVLDKLEQNRRKYPSNLFKGKAFLES
jgi:dCTP diphosphatase